MVNIISILTIWPLWTSLAYWNPFEAPAAKEVKYSMPRYWRWWWYEFNMMTMTLKMATISFRESADPFLLPRPPPLFWLAPRDKDIVATSQDGFTISQMVKVPSAIVKRVPLYTWVCTVVHSLKTLSLNLFSFQSVNPVESKLKLPLSSLSPPQT